MNHEPIDPIAPTSDNPQGADAVDSDDLWLTCPPPNGTDALIDIIEDLEDLEMEELGQVYVSLQLHFARQPTDSYMATRLRQAARTYWERLDHEDVDGLHSLLCGIHEGLAQVFVHNRAIVIYPSPNTP